MADEPEQQPIIIKKINKGHGGHGGAWKVAYADFVTAMMALFIVLWIMGQDQGVKEAVASYFQDPIGYSNKTKKFLDGKSNMPGAGDPKKLKEEEKKQLQEMSSQMISELQKNAEFGSLLKQVEVKMVKEGLRIELIDSDNDLFFQVGTPELNNKAEKLLEKIGGKLAKLPNKIIVEGHTDSRPYMGHGRGYSNFELSTERANSARRALLKGGLPEGRFEEVRGYADRVLKDKNDPFNPVNRRISIILKYKNQAPPETKKLSEISKLK